MGSRSRPRLTLHDVHLSIKMGRVSDAVRQTLSSDLSLDVNQLLFGASALSLSLYHGCDEVFHLLMDRHLRTLSINLDLDPLLAPPTMIEAQPTVAQTLPTTFQAPPTVAQALSTWTPVGLDREVAVRPVDLNQLSLDPHRRLEPALVTAVRLGHEVAVRRLLECGANIEAVDGFNHTALWTAARERRFSIAIQLLCGGATVYPSTRSVSLPVFAASRLSSRHTDMTRLLVLAGADDTW